jgi:3-hydroxyisobutyrate dehydrogenase-like beta-hydroxyacid dehydrogenase
MVQAGLDLNIGMIGYGEVGKTFAHSLQPMLDPDQTGRVGVWDLKFADPQQTAMKASAALHGLLACAHMQALCQRSTLLISAVTASSTLAVAREAALNLQPGTFFLDLNSASPRTKQQSAVVIESAGGYYVEAGVMTPVPPYGLKVPMLLGGPQAARLAQLLDPLGLKLQVVSDQVGIASAIKMCRSVMVKGLEALVIESFATARSYGVESHMIPTLYETFPGIDWNQQAAYFFSRVVQHGKRRADEMREAARTVEEAGFAAALTAAIASKQDLVSAWAAAGVFDGITAQNPWQDYADRLNHAVAQALE